jgi:hypothetical protein
MSSIERDEHTEAHEDHPIYKVYEDGEEKMT